MQSTFIFAHLIDEWTFRCIAGGIIFVLFIILLFVLISERKRINKEQKNRQDWEKQQRQKLEYVHKHMDVFGIKD